jgi:uncharacterized OB-fold protein
VKTTDPKQPAGVDGTLAFSDLDPLAPLSPDSLPFWEGVQREELRLPRCRRCRRLIAYPRSFCPHCQFDQVTWETLDGTGSVWSFTVIHHSRQAVWEDVVPYVVAVVEVEPGARLTARLVECDPAAVAIGMPVRISFVERPDGLRIPVLRPR